MPYKGFLLLLRGLVMSVDTSNEFVRNAIGLLALFTPMFLFIRIQKLIKYRWYRTKKEYIILALLTIVSISTYVFGLEIHSAIFLGIISLVMFGFIVAGDWLSKF